MSRIKFRVWNKKLKEMAYFDDPQIITDSPTTALTFWLNAKEAYRPDMDTGSEYNLDPVFELLLFTGLTDSSRKEIYEGDILTIKYTEKYASVSGKDPINKFKCVKVQFDQGCFSFLPLNEAVGYGLYPIISHYYQFESEVLGNIYENPQLFKEKS